MMSREQLHNLSGGYVLNALDEHERRAFAECLADWDEMLAEVTELADTVVALGLAVAPVHPEPGLRERVLDEAAHTEQWAPLQSARDTVAHRHRALGPRRGADRPGRKATRVLVSLAAAVIAVVLGITVGSTLLPDAQPGGVTFARLQSAPDARRTATDVAGARGVALVWSGELSAAALVWDSMPSLRDGRVYEAWYIDGSARPAGVLHAAPDGSGTQVLAGRMRSGDQVAVTVEPAGGSDRPTSAVIAVLDPAA